MTFSRYPVNIGALLTVTIHQQFIADESSLECGSHKSVIFAGVGEDGEVDPEEEEVEDERDNDETDHPGKEVFGDTFLYYVLEKRLLVGNQMDTLSDFFHRKRPQRSTMTAIPIEMTVRIPLTLEDQVQAMKNPVASIQAHQSNVNSLSDYLSVYTTEDVVYVLTDNDVF